MFDKNGLSSLILTLAPRERLAARLADLCASPALDCFYFGCIGGPGHYLHGPGGSHRLSSLQAELTELFRGLDGSLCWNSRRPEHERYKQRDETEGLAFLTHQGGWTALAFWDRSVDKRGACNSAFFVMGALSFAQTVRVARFRWPKVWARFAFPIVEVDVYGRQIAASWA